MNQQNFVAALLSQTDPSSPLLTIPGGRRWTYGEIDALSANIAGALISAGARPGDRISVQVEKSAENVALYLAALRAGLVYTPLNTAYTAEEVAYFLKDGEPRVFICDPERRAALEPAIQNANTNVVFTLDKRGGGDLLGSAKTAGAVEDISTRHEDDLAVILYTSGTTGRSKGAMLSHGNLESNARALTALWDMTADDRLVHALPIFHIHGLFVALHTAMLAGAEIFFLPKFEINAVRSALANATMLMGVPTFYSRLLEGASGDAASFAHMRLFISGSAPLTTQTHEAFKSRFGHAILERYGMSEAGMIASNPLNGDRRAGTVGYALPGVEIRIVNEKGKPAPHGETGDVEIKGPGVFKGYWRMPEKTEESFRDGWFITGDLGALDADGRLTLVGRAKDLIIAGGYNIYPKEIESALNTIAGVKECAVIGVPHTDMGEGVVAVIVETSPGAVADDALRAELSTLARFKRPRLFFRVDSLPRNAMGKVQKQILRESYQNAFDKMESTS